VKWTGQSRRNSSRGTGTRSRPRTAAGGTAEAREVKGQPPLSELRSPPLSVAHSPRALTRASAARRPASNSQTRFGHARRGVGRRAGPTGNQ